MRVTETPGEFPAPPYLPPPGWPTAPWPPTPRPTRPPGTVQGAVITTAVGAAVSLGLTALFTVFAVFVGSVIWSDFSGGTGGLDLALILVAGVLVSVVVQGLGCWFAWQTWQRRRWARIALAVWSLVVVVFGVFALPFGLVQVGTGTATLVLLFLPDSNAWFAVEP